MNILVIGNGFDLAHGLPTKYEDFLNFIQVIKQIMHLEHGNGRNINDINWKNIPSQVKIILKNNMENDLLSKEDIWNSLIDDNFWIDYFLQCNMYQKENWIDFESEISNVIQSIDLDIKSSNENFNETIRTFNNSFLNGYFLEDVDLLQQKINEDAFKEMKRSKKRLTVLEESEYLKKYQENHPIVCSKERITYEQLIEKLKYDLNRLTRALEIYLTEYVENISINIMSKDIRSLELEGILSFNYTNTFEKIYGGAKKIYDYIHGKANNKNNSIESNNMVLGIDEYLDDESKNKEIYFIAFKKFYQRIYKQTGCEYKKWVDKIREDGINIKKKLKEEFPTQVPIEKFTRIHKVYIFGHSLDITDKDVLRDLIVNDNVFTTIYYLNKKVMGKQIANLIKIIGQDELIRRTGGNTKTIEFVQQSEMIPRAKS
jgi:hypothetical protein